MPNLIYPKALEGFLSGKIIAKSGGDDFRMVLVNNSYTYDASHEFRNPSLPNSNILATSIATTLFNTGAGKASFNQRAFTSLTLTEAISSIIIYQDTGTDTTDRLVCIYSTLFDTSIYQNNLPIEIAQGGDYFVRADDTNGAFSLE